MGHLICYAVFHLLFALVKMQFQEYEHFSWLELEENAGGGRIFRSKTKGRNWDKSFVVRLS